MAKSPDDCSCSGGDNPIPPDRQYGRTGNKTCLWPPETTWTHPSVLRRLGVQYPHIFSGLLLLCASLLLALIAVLKRRSSDARWRQWAILSFLFLSMAVDETSHIHELLKTPGRWLLGPMQKGIFTYAWVIFGIPTVIIVAISYLKFYLHLDPQMKTQFTIAAITFV